MRLTIASRKSDLARIQAYMVGQALKKKIPELQLEYRFRASLGDQNQVDPLWKMPSQGVFTQDFRADLAQGNVDMVVHSWKDLPTQTDGSTILAATLPRADYRDLLLVKKSVLTQIKQKRTLRLLSSSPRRMYNLPEFLKQAFPGGLDEVSFELVRGNIQTRLDKMLQSGADGLIVAKAAIDRLGTADQHNQPDDNFDQSTNFIRTAIEKCHWMVLPASHNPPAAAQGALVVEVSKERQDLLEILEKIDCAQTHADVESEREILASHGGGCHQKIGIYMCTRNEGEVFSIRGKTDEGEVLNQFTLLPAKDIPRHIPKEDIFPPEECANLFSRTEIPATAPSLKKITQADALFLATARIPKEYLGAIDRQIIWASGVTSWFKLAAQNIWVHGVDDNLGANTDRKLEFLLGEHPVWQTLTHSNSPAKDAIFTYDLVPDAKSLNILGAQYFYWRSGSAFKQAIELEPGIKEGIHACGLGRTYKIITEILGGDEKVFPFINEEDWRAQISS